MDLDVEFFIKKFNVSRETIEKLNKYKDFLLSSNKSINLIGKTTENQIFTRHFADSAQIHDLIKDKSQLILVEGLFDMLNMWQLGYHNTLCIFGCTNFSRKKLDILDRIGVTRVDILMDPDVAGQRAANKIAELLDSKNIVSRNIVLPDGVDPGDLTQRQAERYMA